MTYEAKPMMRALPKYPVKHLVCPKLAELGRGLPKN